MTSAARFDPIFPAHAIEQCVATIVFNLPVPPKIHSNLGATHRARLFGAGFTEGPKAVGFQFDVATGKVVPLGDGGPESFVTADRGTTVTISPNQISIQSLQYTRWAHFESSIAKYVLPIVSDFCNSVSIIATKLDYWDRFVWTGTWDNFEASQLLMPSCDLLVPRAVRAAQQWHSHGGWFEYPMPGKRRLFNANIDVVSVNAPNMIGTKPSVGIYTSIQDSAVAVPPSSTAHWIDEADVLANLRQEHLDLKTLLQSIISPAMAQRIGM